MFRDREITHLTKTVGRAVLPCDVTNSAIGKVDQVNKNRSQLLFHVPENSRTKLFKSHK